MPAPFIVGLTGGIGSGKSAAAARFAELGADIVDTDEIARALTAQGGAAIDAIRAAFGNELIGPDGALDRPAMRLRVFDDAQARRQLETILHPLIRDQARRRCLDSRAPYVVLAVPLLIESNHWRERCDRVCVVDCPETLQIERVGARSGLSADEVGAIIAAQASREQRLKAADDVLDNSGDLAALHRQVDALHDRYLTLAAA